MLVFYVASTASFRHQNLFLKSLWDQTKTTNLNYSGEIKIHMIYLHPVPNLSDLLYHIRVWNLLQTSQKKKKNQTLLFNKQALKKNHSIFQKKETLKNKVMLEGFARSQDRLSDSLYIGKSSEDLL